jgi:hypothetical protein
MHPLSCIIGKLEKYKFGEKYKTLTPSLPSSFHKFMEGEGALEKKVSSIRIQ